MSDVVVPAACARNRFSPVQRFAICFGVLFALKYALRFTPVGATSQALVLAAATTALFWALWSAGAANRRGMLLLTGIIWVATAAKVLLQ